MRLVAADCRSAGKAANQGSTTLRHTEVQDRVSGARARKSTQSVSATQSAITARLASDRVISAFSPPISEPQINPSKASSTQSIDGVLMVSPRNMPSISLPLEVRRKIFGIGQAGR